MNSKRILFLCRTDDRAEYDTSWSMASAMGKPASGMTYEAGNYEDLLFSFDGNTLHITNVVSGKGLDEYDGIFLLGWFKTKALEDVALAVARYASKKHISLLNTEALYTRSRTKLSQYVIAGLHGVHITPFVYSMNHAHMIAHMQGQAWSYPLIVKSTMASRGHDNYLVHNAQELRDTLVDQPQVPFIIQDFVPNDGDYRLLVMGDSVRLALHRRSQTGSHLNNTSQGGTATIVNLADLRVEMLNDAVHIAKLLRREVTGVDMIVDAKSGEYYMLEANNMPQLSTGSMVTDKMHVFDSYIAEYFERHGASGPA